MADLMSGVSDTIMNGLQSILYATIYKFLYYLAVGCCWLIDLLYSMFEIMAGLSKVSYDGDFDYLINIFFSNSTVSKVYWGMALIGLAVGFAFAIAAVIKKLFDTNEKEKRSYGQILTGLFKSALIILCMSVIITMVLNATTLLMQQINYVFINADDLGEEQSITYTDEEYAAMARALNTIGNFSLNPSYNNRYNLNKCFNEVRLDLQYLKQQGVFDFHYVTKDLEGNTIATWQSALQRIANSASLDRDLSLDVYHESVSKSILETMELLKVNGSFKPLEDYQRHYQPSRSSLPMDRFLFLLATMRAAKNNDYNIEPSLTDPLRGAYYYGEKSIYDLDTVNEDFDIGIAALDYLILFLTCFVMLETLATIILNCVGRIFNMLLLYLISPLIVSVAPLDDGAKFKQWTTAFVVQSFSVFGTIISMRVLLLFMPVIVDPKLVLFTNPIANFLTKLVIVVGATSVAEKATNLITGILADNAGWQSITAGDMSSTAKSAVGIGKTYAKAAVSGAAGMGLSAVGLGVKGGLKAGVGVGLGAGYGLYYGAKGAVAGGKALANKISAWRNKGGGGEGGGGESKGGESQGGEGQQTDSLPQNQHDTGSGPQDNGSGGPQDIGGGGGQQDNGGGTQQDQSLPQNQHDVGGAVDGGGQQTTGGGAGTGSGTQTTTQMNQNQSTHTSASSRWAVGSAGSGTITGQGTAHTTQTQSAPGGAARQWSVGSAGSGTITGQGTTHTTQTQSAPGGAARQWSVGSAGSGTITGQGTTHTTQTQSAPGGAAQQWSVGSAGSGTITGQGAAQTNHTQGAATGTISQRETAPGATATTAIPNARPSANNGGPAPTKTTPQSVRQRHIDP